jgi:hypothetical protein
MLAELQALYDLGYRGHVDFVDDNLIGNKRALKRFLPELIAWHQARGRGVAQPGRRRSAAGPDEGRFAIFTGIETPDTETLIHTRKKQNTRRDIADSIHKSTRRACSSSPASSSASTRKGRRPLSLGVIAAALEGASRPQAVIRTRQRAEPDYGCQSTSQPLLGR